MNALIQSIAIITIAFLASTTKAVLHKNVYENIDNCPEGLSGNDCSIVYVTCSDKKRRCFNNSQCSVMDEPNTNGYEYECNCFFAESVSPTAGYECEHSATITCPENHFCTNGGTCGTYNVHGHEYGGCNCPKDFTGAHCQYLIETMEGGLEGETTSSSGKVVVEKTHLNLLYGFSYLFGICVAASLVYSLFYVVKYYKQKKAVYSITPTLRPSEDGEVA